MHTHWPKTYRNDFTHIPDIYVRDVQYHRNGSSCEGFFVVLFSDLEAGVDFVATVFDTPGQVAVLATGTQGLSEGVITFGINSWRGDRYEDSLRRAIEDWQTKESR